MEREEAVSLFEKNTRLVYFIMYKKLELAYDEDLYQEGSIGLWRACITYDEKLGKFSTYAGICIENAITNCLRKKKLETVSIQEIVPGSDDLTYEDILSNSVPMDELIDPKSETIRKAFEHAKNTLTEKDYTVMMLLANGIKEVRIAELLGVSRQSINDRKKRIRERTRGLFK